MKVYLTYHSKHSIPLKLTLHSSCVGSNTKLVFLLKCTVQHMMTHWRSECLVADIAFGASQSACHLSVACSAHDLCACVTFLVECTLGR